MTILFARVLEMSLTAAAVITAILIIRLPLRRAPRKYSYLLWSAAAFRLMCPVSFRAKFSIFRLGRTAGGTTALFDPSPAVSALPGGFSAGTAVEPAAPFEPKYVLSYPAVSPITTPDPTRTFLRAAAVIWLVGVAALVIYGIVSYARQYRRMSTAVRLDGNVWQSDRVRSPFILGLLHPRIYIPFGLAEEPLRYVLAHERYHLKRLDHAVRLLAFFLLAVHWFNPFVWLAYYLASRDMELSCDEKVLAEGENIRRTYSITLLAFAANRRFPTPCPPAFGESGIKSRVKNALNWKKPRLWVSILAVTVCAAAIAACSADPSESAEHPFDRAGNVPVSKVSCDVTHDGTEETIALHYDAETMVYLLSVETAEGKVIWQAEASTVHTGYMGYYLYEENGLFYLLRWNPACWGGSYAYSYEIFALNGVGEEQLLREKSLSFDTGSNDQILAIDVEDLRIFEAELNTLLAQSIVLIDTNDGAALYSTAEHPLTRQWAPTSDHWAQLRQRVLQEQERDLANTLAIWTADVSPADGKEKIVIQDQSDLFGDVCYTIEVRDKNDYPLWTSRQLTEFSGTLFYLLYDEGGKE